jgi:energy-coupling factor transport system ATP-binding protein
LNGLIPHLYPGEIKGAVTVNGKNIANEKIASLSFEVGTVLQDTDGQFIGLTVAEDIAFALENDEFSNDIMTEKVSQWSKKVEIDEYLTHRPQDLSGGQKQRVSIAGVLINEAPILLFDEPLANLDPKAGKDTIELIDELHHSAKITTIIIEHRLEDAIHRSVDRIIVFSNGEIVSDSSTSDLLKSDTLIQLGIREPLYVSAMKYAKVDLEKIKYIEDVNKVTSSELREKIEVWCEHIKEEPIVKSEEKLLEISKVNYSYPETTVKVLNDISFDIFKGERISIVGKNGAGKSTLAKAICGFVKYFGKMTYKDEDLSLDSIKERADKIGYVMQNPNQMISQNLIFDEVALGLKLRDVPEKEIEERVNNTLKICGLHSFRKWPISALSFGQKKRVTIAAILVLEPQLIILDEPTAGQDFKHYSEMMAFLDTLNALGITIIMITHDMHLMLEYSDRTIVVLGGEVIADSIPAEVLTDDELIEKASLKETSLFTFAKAIGLDEPLEFTKHFIAFDREVRKHG